MGRLIIDGNQVYEIDEECMKHKREEEALMDSSRQRKQKEQKSQKEQRSQKGQKSQREQRTKQNRGTRRGFL